MNQLPIREIGMYFVLDRQGLSGFVVEETEAQIEELYREGLRSCH